MTTETASGDETIEPKVKMPEKSEDANGCPECGSSRFEEIEGETYCMNCGTVVDTDRIDTTREYRAFDSESTQKKERVGSTITYTKADKGMSTKIGETNELNKVSGRKRGQYYRMKKWDSRSDSREDSLQKGLSIIDRLTYELNLPKSVKEEAGRLYEKASEEDLIKGKSREASVAAILYLVARSHEVPRTQKEIGEATKVKQRKMNKTYRDLARELDLDIRPADPKNFIPRYASEVGLSGEASARARKIVKEAMDKGVTSGRSPSSVSSAALYIGALLEGDKVTQKEVAEVAGVTQTTVRKTYRLISEELGLEEEIEEAKN
ncbi:transcription initiation factor IIB [Candidatus Nanosalina sp. VS9-1]|uniref:transcription initiation factor IIB n=1 Tax=Candidatus Nanosalina sp. VS9-1 TaxID=3388566 RepID=UPI0039E0EF17